MATSSLSLANSKVLVVDDTPANIDVLVGILEAEGYSVSFATNGEKAIQLCRLDRPDLILLDVMMPVMDGFETCRRLKMDYELADIPVIFVTGKTEARDIAAAFEAGGVDYITKPVRQEEVVARVRTHLALRSLIHQREELIERLRNQNEEIRRISQQDAMTKLANRGHFNDTLDRKWAEAQAKGQKLSVILLDIDFFKRYNDTYGHQGGDECIAAVANALGGCIDREIGLVARYGGEEFIALLPNIEGEQATDIANHMCDTVKELQIPHKSSDVASVVTISVGVADCIPTPDTTADALVSTADDALYEAKKAGRGRVHCF